MAGGNGDGSAVNQFDGVPGLDIDDDNQSIIIADFENHRIVEWKMGASNGKIVAGNRGKGDGLDELSWPTDVLMDKETNSLFIAEGGNQ